ncbi:putative glycosyl transferase [Methylocaldum marinum]|uniref:Putative glycosyl transferase n=1 Tax=Methylocaldum marinum TaxID=1432792 RepID=A0A250KM09_9GAMM|nr:glycosyltransferase family 2 protein [Methylocaldum marinum]BBA32760.1 putative glycosyl transferase [Methylocaldum marinum]
MNTLKVDIKPLEPGTEAALFDISIIIVNYNGGDLVLRCLQSIFTTSADYTFELIFIDNASADGSLQRVKESFPGVRITELPRNLGLAAAFNLGLKQATGRYLLSLDNDTRILPDALSSLVRFMDNHPQTGAVGSLLLNPDMSPQKTARLRPSAINAVFGRRSLITKIWPGNPWSRKYLMESRLTGSDPFQVWWVSTAALMVRKEVYEQIGGLDEDFFVYWVDADWCERINKAGWQIYAVPDSKIIHDENLKAGRRARKNYRMLIDFHRGAYLYFVKHHAKSPYHPKGLIALIGLSLRAAFLISVDYLKYLPKR